MHRFLSIVWWLSVCSVCSVGTLRSQPANVQADPTTGVLFRPSAATFISGNNLASATGGIVLGANGGTGVANTGKTITLGGNVTTSGAFGLTLTLTAATGVTLPTTGTLATLAGSETLTNKTLTSPTLTTPTLGTATATSLTLSGNISSSAWTTSGVRLKGVAATLTDTTSTGTVAAAYTDVLGGNTIAASSATTYTDYITAFFKEPTAGSLVTMTNKWALGGESLRIGTSTPMSVSPAGAITANSLTGRTTTDLTLAGGSTGASLVLGQGASGVGTLASPATSGLIQILSLRAPWSGSGQNIAALGFNASTAGEAAGNKAGLGLTRNQSNGRGRISAFLNNANTTATFTNTDEVLGIEYGAISHPRLTFNTGGTQSAATNAIATFYQNQSEAGIVVLAGTGGGYTLNALQGGGANMYRTTGAVGSESSTLTAQFSPTGNLLIGTTTDMSGVAGGLKVAATNASSGAGSGALQVAGGIYAGANSYFGGSVSLVNASDSNMSLTRTGGVGLALSSRASSAVVSSGGALVLESSYATALTLAASTGAATFAGAVITSSATLSGAGAIPITTSLVKFTSTGAAQALTLANGVDGQRLTIVHDVDGGSGVLTPTTKTGFSTVTFTSVGETVSLVYVTTRGWMVTGSYLATIAP